MRSERFYNILSLIFIVIILFFIIALTVDLNRTKHNQAPVFVFETTAFDDGSKRYTGLLYSVYYFLDTEDVNASSYHLTPWFTDFELVKIVLNGLPVDE